VSAESTNVGIGLIEQLVNSPQSSRNSFAPKVRYISFPSYLEPSLEIQVQNSLRVGRVVNSRCLIIQMLSGCSSGFDGALLQLTNQEVHDVFPFKLLSITWPNTQR
jgi:hypothetical protein